MFSKIMVPVDLAHEKALTTSLRCAGDLGKHYGAEVTYVGVTSAAPGKLAHTPEEFDARLKAFASAQAEAHGISGAAHMRVSHDPSVDLDAELLSAADELGTDLIVMASHVPGLREYIWASNGGKIAEHAKCTVMVVRD